MVVTVGSRKFRNKAGYFGVCGENSCSYSHVAGQNGHIKDQWLEVCKSFGVCRMVRNNAPTGSGGIIFGWQSPRALFWNEPLELFMLFIHSLFPSACL